jgi:copper chaperone
MKNIIEFTIEDMTCNGCVKRISKAILNLDESAQIQTDLERKTVIVQSEISNQQSLTDALTAIGYTPKYN